MVDTWSIIDKYFSQTGSDDNVNPLVSHQIESFNEFLDKKITQIIHGFNAIQICHNYNEEFNDFSYKIYINIINPTLTKPVFQQQDGSQIVMTPHVARMNGLTYAVNIHADIQIITETKNKDGINERNVNKVPNISFGKIPIMVRSKACILNRVKGIVENNDRQECKYDFGGYFIVNGNEKVVVSQDRISENKTVIFSANGSLNEGLTAEIRSSPDGLCLPAKTTSISMSAKPNHLGRTIRINTSFLRSEVPLFIMFRALGIETDKLILNHIVYNLTDKQNIRILEEMKATIDDSSDIYSQEQALNFLLKYTVMSGIPREYLEDPKEARKVVLNIIKRDFLPHVGDSIQRKALYLGYMVRKLLNTYLGYQPLDNRDSYLHKRIDTPGILMSNLFRQCWGKMIKEMRTAIQRELQLWRASPNIPKDIINSSNIHRFIKYSVIETGIRYALSTGNWGIKILGSLQNIRTGVAQVLNRMSYLSTLSHLRRINTPMEKNGKLVQPRKLENSQFGVICPAETPEGCSVGLVKNMSLSTRITTSLSSAYVRTCINKSGIKQYDDTITNIEEYLDTMGNSKNVHVYFNGDIIGYHDNPVELYDKMKEYKRKGNIPPTTCIAWDIRNGSIIINTEAGRMCRPLYIVDTMSDGTKKLRIEKLIEEDPTLKARLSSMTFTEYLAFLDKNEEGFIEYLDVEEIDKAMVAMFPEDLKKKNKKTYIPPNYTHCEIHPSLMLGVLACNIPFSDHNQSPRNCYQCLYEEEPVLMENGTQKKIKDVKKGDRVFTFDPETMKTSITTVINQYVKPTDKNIVEVTTYSGRKIITTDDHKYMTNMGWLSPKEFNNETRVGILMEPKNINNEVKNVYEILSETEFENIMKKNNVKLTLIEKHKNKCKEIGLLPLYSDNPKLHVLARIAGFILTDGCLNIYNKKHGGNTPQVQACFGTYKDAIKFEDDVKHLGINTVVPREGIRMHTTSNVIHHTFDVCHNGILPSLLIALGISFGKKTETERKEIPAWIKNGTCLVKREFCAGIQGGDGCMIRYNKRKSGYNYICAKTSQQINPKYQESLTLFMEQIVEIIRELDIEVSNIRIKNIKENRVEVSYKIADKQQNLIKYYDTIGYRYSSHKNINSAIVTEFLKWRNIEYNSYIEKVLKLHEQFENIKDKSELSSIVLPESISYSTLDGLYRSYKNKRKIGMPHFKYVNIEKWIDMIEVKDNTMFIPVKVNNKENCMIADITVESNNHSFFGGDHFAVHNSAMGKQAVGIYMSNYNKRIDTLGHVLNYPQKPLVRTKLSKFTNSDNLPSGANAIVAIMTKTGYNQEDSVMVNKGALDRGLFTSTYYKAYRDQCMKNHSTGEEEIFTKPIPTTSHIKPYNYDKLNEDGIIPKNTFVDDNDIILGKVMPHKVQGQIFPRDASITMKTNDNGHIDETYCGINSEGYKFCKIRLRNYRKPTIGDKLSSRHGQKGTIGMVYNQEDMPFNKEGICPDIIVNPHAIPSRMTVGQLIECIMGKSSAILGTYGDATPFTDCSVEKIADVLESHGLERYGNEILYNGRTGEMIKTEIFIGPTFYQRLKHMVIDKAHCLTMDHEILTEKGWKLFHEIEEGDKVATLKEGHLIYEKPINKYYYPEYRGKMYHISNSAIDLDVTEEHRMWVSKFNQKNKSWNDYELELSKDIIGKYRRYKKDAIWDVPEYQFILPMTNTKRMKFKEWDVPMDAWLTLFGIWIAEGYVYKDDKDYYRVEIAANKERVKKAIINIEKQLNIEFRKTKQSIEKDTEGFSRYCLTNQQIGKYLYYYSVGASNKYLPEWVWKLNMEQCKSLINGMMLGDGTWTKTGTEVYHTSSNKLADDFQRLCLHAGWCANKKLHIKAGTTTIIRGKKVTTRYDSYRITIVKKFTKPSVNHGHVKKQNYQREMMYNYEGPVFCLSVSSEVFMVRRNGKAVWTGNSRGSNGPVVKIATVGIARYLLVYGMVGNTIKLREKPIRSIVPRFI